jgi:hypothetical protein
MEKKKKKKRGGHMLCCRCWFRHICELDALERGEAFGGEDLVFSYWVGRGVKFAFGDGIMGAVLLLSEAMNDLDLRFECFFGDVFIDRTSICIIWNIASSIQLFVSMILYDI